MCEPPTLERERVGLIRTACAIIWAPLPVALLVALRWRPTGYGTVWEECVSLYVWALSVIALALIGIAFFRGHSADSRDAPKHGCERDGEALPDDQGERSDPSQVPTPCSCAHHLLLSCGRGMSFDDHHITLVRTDGTIR